VGDVAGEHGGRSYRVRSVRPGDFGRWFALTTDDFEFVTSPDIPDAGTYYGEEARRWITAWVRSFEGHTMEATEIIDAGGDNVFAGFLQRGHPRGSQSTVEGRWWLVVTFRQDAMARIEVFADRAEALEAAGLRE
jgi:ketosteroid isomerase-like protein